MSLTAIRGRIDDVDRQLVDLLDQRFALTRSAALEKQRTGQPIADPKREIDVIARAQTLSKCAPDSAIASVFAEIIRTSKADQVRIVS